LSDQKREGGNLSSARCLRCRFVWFVDDLGELQTSPNHAWDQRALGMPLNERGETVSDVDNLLSR